MKVLETLGSHLPRIIEKICTPQGFIEERQWVDACRPNHSLIRPGSSEDKAEGWDAELAGLILS